MSRKIIAGLCAAAGTLSLCAAPLPPLRVQQNHLSDRQQMQQRQLQQRQLNRTPEQPPQIRPVRSDIRQNPTPQERQQIRLENHQQELQQRQQQIAPPPQKNP